MSTRPPFVTRRRLIAGALRAFSVGVWTSAVGCPLFHGGGSISEEPVSLSPESAPAPSVREAVQVEIVFIERPLDDPLLGDMLWRDLDQVGAVDGSVRTELERHGIRVGHCGATPPEVLQRLLGMTTQIVEVGPGARDKTMSGKRIGLPAGDDFEIQASPVYPHCDIRLEPDGDESRAFDLARCVLRLSAAPIQDGWVRLDFQPEVHHGDHRLRHVATDGGFRLRESQEVVPVYPLQFSTELGLHEMVVVGWEPRAEQSLGRHFFVGHDEDAARQRLLVVRVAGVEKGKLVPID